MTRLRLVSVLALSVLVGVGGASARGTTLAPSGADLAGATGDGALASDVRSAMSTGNGGRMVSVIVTLHEQAELRPIAALDHAARLRAAIVALHATANRTQGRVVGLLRARSAQGQVETFVPLWVFNGIAVTATPEVIAELGALPEVAEVTLDQAIDAPPAVPATAAPEPNVSVVNAPALWNLGYSGSGVVVASMDTGVDLSHPELGSRWRGGTNSWFDPNGQHATPTDVNGHGTWTMGVMVGGDAGGTSIGIAPGAKWIAVKIFNDQGSATTSRIHAGFQWLLDPDGNPGTADAPNVVNNSWAMSGPGCNLDFKLDLENLRAAGLLPVFAAGNYGPSPSTSASPANNPAAFAVGATNNGDIVESESSRGPSSCGEPSTIFPELVAPGASIRTTDLYGLYTSQTGTSMAAPHVTGGLALLLDAFPDLSANDQAAALENGAVDLGASGPDNAYGYGRLDLLSAYQSLASTPDFTLAVSPASANTLPGGAASYTVAVTPRNGFAGDVALTLSGLTSSQATWSFSPTTISGGSGSSQLTVTTTSSITPGNYPLNITGTSGARVHSAPATLVVNPPPDFTLVASPASASAPPGGAVSYTIAVTSQNAFAGDVALTLSGLTSSQATWSFSPAAIVGGSGLSQLSVSTSSSISPGSYPLTITGTSGATVHSASVTLVVSPPPDFALSVSPATRSVKRGRSTTYVVTVTPQGGFSGSVSLSVAGLPWRATAAFNPPSITGSGTSTMTVTTSSVTPRGTFTLIVTGSSGPVSHQATATLTVTK